MAAEEENGIGKGRMDRAGVVGIGVPMQILTESIDEAYFVDDKCASMTMREKDSQAGKGFECI